MSALVVHHLDGCLVDVHADDALEAVVVHLFRQSRHAAADIEYQVGLSNRHRQDIFDAHPPLVPVEVVFDSASVDPTRCTCSPKTFHPNTNPLLFNLRMFNNYIHAVACRLPNVVSLHPANVTSRKSGYSLTSIAKDASSLSRSARPS